MKSTGLILVAIFLLLSVTDGQTVTTAAPSGGGGQSGGGTGTGTGGGTGTGTGGGTGGNGVSMVTGSFPIIIAGIILSTLKLT